MLAIMFHTNQNTYTCSFLKQVSVENFNERLNESSFSENSFKQSPKLKIKQNFQSH